MRIIDEIFIGKKAFGDALFERNVLKEAQTQVASVHAKKLKDTCTTYKRPKFNQALAISKEKRARITMKSFDVDAVSPTTRDETRWLNWALNANVKVK